MVQVDHGVSQTHHLAHDLAARRLQVTGRFVIARNKVAADLERGFVTKTQAEEKQRELRMMYVRNLAKGEWAMPVLGVVE
jgi:hypothetical protein